MNGKEEELNLNAESFNSCGIAVLNVWLFSKRLSVVLSRLENFSTFITSSCSNTASVGIRVTIACHMLTTHKMAKDMSTYLSFSHPEKNVKDHGEIYDKKRLEVAFEDVHTDECRWLG